MKISMYRDYVLPAALSLLPAKLNSVQAKAMVIAICLQESRLDARHQLGGPAHGYAQFEVAGIRGVLRHPASQHLIRDVLAALDYLPDPVSCFEAVEHNDILGAAFSRLLLWTLPDGLPEQSEPQKAWEQYLRAWRPGRPRAANWESNFALAWTSLTTEEP